MLKLNMFRLKSVIIDIKNMRKQLPLEKMVIPMLKKILLLRIIHILKNLFSIMNANMNDEPRKFRFDWISFISGVLSALAAAFGVSSF